MSAVKVKQKSLSLVRRLVVAITVGVLFAGSVQAVTISPVVIKLTPAQRIVAVTVSNESDQPLTLQVETLAWTQHNGEDREIESDDLLVVPPLAEIPPGASQLFRVTLRRPTLAPVERAYRLVLEDVGEITRQFDGVGVNLVFAHRLPVFVAGSGKHGAKPQLGSCSEMAPAGCVRIDNLGDRFVQIKKITVTGRDWSKELGAGHRVLANSWKEWNFDWPPGQTWPLTVHAETTSGPLTIELPAGRP